MNLSAEAISTSTVDQPLLVFLFFTPCDYRENFQNFQISEDKYKPAHKS